MITFIINTNSGKYHVQFQSNTEIGQSNYHFGNDVSVSMWDQLMSSITMQSEVLPIESFQNQDSDVISTKLSFKNDQFIFTVKYTEDSKRGVVQEKCGSHIFASAFIQFHQHLNLVKNAKPL